VCVFIGHNPMIEHFAFHLAHKGKDSDLKKLKMGFSTATIAVFDVGAFPASPQTRGELTHYLQPNNP
jgi:phosphohistidine phosphatase SixA